MNIGNFLEFECAFQCNIIVKRTTDIKNVLVKSVFARKSFNRIDIGKSFAYLRGNFFEHFDQFFFSFRRNGFANLRHVECKHKHQNKLSGVSLCGGNRNFRSRPSMNYLIRFTGD